MKRGMSSRVRGFFKSTIPSVVVPYTNPVPSNIHRGERKGNIIIIKGRG